MQSLNKLSRKAFYAIGARERWDSPIECERLILLPLGVSLHGGYRFMDAVAVAPDKTLITRVAGGFDVFDLNSPSDIWTKERTPNYFNGWSIDCLARSGLFCIFARGFTIKVGASLSSLHLHPLNI